jgi:SAM-dependent methyltransferase
VILRMVSAQEQDDPMALERWSGAEAYEPFMGRWSRRLASAALTWLAPEAGQRWLDVGCGTGAVSEAVVTDAAPASLVGVDQSEAYVSAAGARVADARARFEVGDAGSLPLPDGSVDHAVSGLVLNFVPDARAAVGEMRRVLATGGRVSAWVWDYADGMQMLRVFWDAVIEEHPPSADLDEGARFPVCAPGGLRRLFTGSGLTDVVDGEVTIPMVFTDFDDYWQPFLGGQGPASAYLLALPEERLDRLRDLVRAALPTDPDGTIRISARAWITTGRST